MCGRDKMLLAFTFCFRSELPLDSNRAFISFGSILCFSKNLIICVRNFLNPDFSFSDISDVKADGFTVGFQFGGGIELGNFGIDLRLERAFSAIESRFIGTTGTAVNFDTRINQVILGVSYRL